MVQVQVDVIPDSGMAYVREGVGVKRDSGHDDSVYDGPLDFLS